MTAPVISHLPTLARPLLSWLAVVLLTSRAIAAPTQQERDRAIVHFNEGNEAFSRGDTHEAYREYQTAWQLNQTFDIACNLGRAEAELGKLSQAAEHLSYCLENFSASPQADLKDARHRYAELFQTVREQVSTLNFHVEPEGAELLLNGTSLGTAPFSGNVFVLPGTQVIELRLDGYDDLKREIPARAGETRRLELRLTPVAAVRPEASAPVGADASAATSPPSRTKSLVVLTTSALTVAGAGVGLGFFLQSRKLDDEATALKEQIVADHPGEANPCGGNATPACTKLANTVDSRDQARAIAAGGFIAMGVFGLGSLATWLWWPESPAGATAPTTSTVFVPILTGHEIGAAWVGRM